MGIIDIPIENETFSAYRGRYKFDVDKAYELIKTNKVKFIEKVYQPDMMHFLSHPEFSQTSDEKIKNIKVDYSKPIGLIVNFKNPETNKTEYLLIDGNHRTRKAIEEDKPANFYVIQNPEDVDKFMIIDKNVEHKMFDDEIEESFSLLEILMNLFNEAKSSRLDTGQKVPGKYLTKNKEAMKKEIKRVKKLKADDPSAYGKWEADYADKEKTKKYKTKKSKATIAFEKKFGK